MKIAAIIAEYNPFHNGHKYQIDKARQLLGENTAIIAVMSGNFTQRGEIAICDKTVRARAAVDSGVNLVLELPFPFSSSSAEFFAKSGVRIIERLGIVDYLVFGSECGNARLLSEISDNMQSDIFKAALERLSEKEESLGYPKLCEIAYRECFSADIGENFFSPNNILAIEYLKALRSEKSSVEPLTIRREGAGYSDSFQEATELQSASAIREMLEKKSDSAFEYIPNSAKSAFEDAIEEKHFPADAAALDVAVISHFRLNSPKAFENIHDALGGLYNRLIAKSKEANSISSLIELTETKKYTKARIRRAILNCYLGVTSSDVRSLPCYTQALAMDQTGRQLLKRIKKMNGITVLTKPSAYDECDELLRRQKELSARADSIYALSLPKPMQSSFALTFTPYVKK